MKPIFVCRLPSENIDLEMFRNIEFNLKMELSENYHVLIITDNHIEEIEFELYNSELEEKDFEDLKLKLKL
jgi:hypothetical protein